MGSICPRAGAGLLPLWAACFCHSVISLVRCLGVLDSRACPFKHWKVSENIAAASLQPFVKVSMSFSTWNLSTAHDLHYPHPGWRDYHLIRIIVCFQQSSQCEPVKPVIISRSFPTQHCPMASFFSQRKSQKSYDDSECTVYPYHYLSDFVFQNPLPRSFPSSFPSLLALPQAPYSCFCLRALALAVSSVWNPLSPGSWTAWSLAFFRSLLKCQSVSLPLIIPFNIEPFPHPAPSPLYSSFLSSFFSLTLTPF